MDIHDDPILAGLPLSEDGNPLLGRYEVLRRLGEGGMGAVYLSRHRDLKKLVSAVKVLTDRRSSAIDRFRREAQLSALLQHANLVRVSDFDEVDGRVLLAMEYVDGANLKQRVRQGGPMSVGKVEFLLRDACRGLAFAHDHGVVHRDIKPDNILLSKRDDVKIADFGIAKGVDEDGVSLTGSNAMLGTPRYVAPEQISNAKGVDAAADVWSLGLTGYFALTGEHVVPGDSLGAILGAITDSDLTSAVRGLDLPPRLAAVLQRAIARRPEDRFANAGEMLEALEDARRARRRQATQPAVTKAPEPAAEAVEAEPETVERQTVDREAETVGDTAAAEAREEAIAEDAEPTSVRETQVGQTQVNRTKVRTEGRSPGSRRAPRRGTSPRRAAASQPFEETVVEPHTTERTAAPTGRIALAVAALLLLGGGGYWMFSGSGTEVLAADSPLARGLAQLRGTNGKVDQPGGLAALEQLREQGDPLATMWLARLHHRGDAGLTPDPSTAARLARSALDEVERLRDGGHLEAKLLLAVGLAEGIGMNRSPGAARQKLREAAEAGSLTAEYELGRLDFGRDLALPKNEVLRRLRRAADAKYAPARLALAERLAATGDDQGALQWSRAAAEQGLPRAYLAYADRLFASGDSEAAARWWDASVQARGVESLIARAEDAEPGRALALYAVAAEHGSAPALRALADRALAKQDAEQAEHWLGKLHAATGDDVARDELIALRWERSAHEAALPLLKEAAADGDVPSMMRLAEAYRLGLGTEPNLEEAKRLLGVAAEADRPDAALTLAQLLLDGDGGESDDERAASLVAAAASANSEAAELYGFLLFSGRGVAENRVRAKSYLERVAASGNGIRDPKAAGALGVLNLEDGDYTTARRLIGPVRDHVGFAAAAHGDLCLVGGDLEPDIDEALRYYRRALELGHEASREKVDTGEQVVSMVESLEQSLQESSIEHLPSAISAAEALLRAEPQWAVASSLGESVRRAKQRRDNALRQQLEARWQAQLREFARQIDELEQQKRLAVEDVDAVLRRLEAREDLRDGLAPDYSQLRERLVALRPDPSRPPELLRAEALWKEARQLRLDVANGEGRLTSNKKQDLLLAGSRIESAKKLARRLSGPAEANGKELLMQLYFESGLRYELAANRARAVDKDPFRAAAMGREAVDEFLSAASEASNVGAVDAQAIRRRSLQQVVSICDTLVEYYEAVRDGVGEQGKDKASDYISRYRRIREQARGQQ